MMYITTCTLFFKAGIFFLSISIPSLTQARSPERTAFKQGSYTVTVVKNKESQLTKLAPRTNKYVAHYKEGAIRFLSFDSGENNRKGTHEYLHKAIWGGDLPLQEYMSPDHIPDLVWVLKNNAKYGSNTALLKDRWVNIPILTVDRACQIVEVFKSKQVPDDIEKHLAEQAYSYKITLAMTDDVSSPRSFPLLFIITTNDQHNYPLITIRCLKKTAPYLMNVKSGEHMDSVTVVHRTISGRERKALHNISYISNPEEEGHETQRQPVSPSVLKQEAHTTQSLKTAIPVTACVHILGSVPAVAPEDDSLWYKTNYKSSQFYNTGDIHQVNSFGSLAFVNRHRESGASNPFISQLGVRKTAHLPKTICEFCHLFKERENDKECFWMFQGSINAYCYRNKKIDELEALFKQQQGVTIIHQDDERKITGKPMCRKETFNLNRETKQLVTFEVPRWQPGRYSLKESEPDKCLEALNKAISDAGTARQGFLVLLVRDNLYIITKENGVYFDGLPSKTLRVFFLTRTVIEQSIVRDKKQYSITAPYSVVEKVDLYRSLKGNPYPKSCFAVMLDKSAQAQDLDDLTRDLSRLEVSN